jgi:nucleotide-binding universal stress UspA family protein
VSGMKRILVGLDNSPRASSVLDAALVVARAFGAKLHLFRAVGLSPDIPAEAYSAAPDLVVQRMIERGTRELEDFAGRVPPDLLGGTSAHIGTPWQAICDAAKEVDAELILIGSHGYTGLDRLLGTTAAKVVNHADRSVLVVR